MEQETETVRYEVIVVDNNSTDNTAEIVRSFSVCDIPVRYIFEPRIGVSHGRNAGVLAARAEVIAFTDDDVRAEKGWVGAVHRTLLERPDVDCIGGKILPHWPGSLPRWLDRRHWSPLAVLDYGDDVIEISAGNPRCLLTANMAIRRPVFDRVGYFSPAFPRCQDHELQLRYWRAGGRALYVPELVTVAEVAGQRLDKRYHRDWHRTHGEFSALMQSDESIGADASLQPVPVSSHVVLFGSPGYLYRELIHEAASWVRASLLMRGSEVFAHANRIRFLRAYLRTRSAVTRGERPSVAQCLGSPASAVILRPPDDGAARPAPSSTRMSWRRLLFVHVLLACLVGGHLYDIVTDQEHWPFSQYPMFSNVDESRTHRTLRVFGVTAGTELPLLSPAYIHPFDQCRLSTALLRLSDRTTVRRDLDEALSDVWHRYEARRIAGHNGGPALTAVRLYSLEWNLDPKATNARTPETREVLAEFQPSSRAQLVRR